MEIVKAFSTNKLHTEIIIKGTIEEPLFKDSIGYMMDGGQLHEHVDPNQDGLIHTRFNLYVQIPHEGGYPIYAGKTLRLKERTYICCRAGIDPHYCEKVEGDRERIIISYGFLFGPSVGSKFTNTASHPLSRKAFAR